MRRTPPIEVQVVERAVGAHLQADRVLGGQLEALDRGGIGHAVRAGEHHPDAVPRVVGPEQRVLVGRRERRSGVEGKARDRGADRRRGRGRWAVVGRRDVERVAVGHERRFHGIGLAVERLADVEVQRVVAGLSTRALVAGPAEVHDAARGRIGDPVDLLPVVPADVAEPDLVGARPEREPERVAEAVGDDPAGVGIAVAEQGVAGESGASGGIDPEDRAVERDRVAAGAQVLRSERPAGGRRRGLRPTDPSRGIVAGVLRAALLAVVGDVEVGAVTAADVEGAVGTERQVADRVAGELLAPVLDQHGLAGRHVAARGEARDATGDHAAVGRGAGRRRTAVRRLAGDPPARRGAADRRVERVGDVDVRCRRKVRVEGQPEHAPVPEVVDLGAEIRKHGGRGVREVVENEHAAALLGDEDAAVGGELDVGGVGQPAEGALVDEVGGQRCQGCGSGLTRGHGLGRQRGRGQRGDSHEGERDRDDRRPRTPANGRPALGHPLSAVPSSNGSRHHRPAW